MNNQKYLDDMYNKINKELNKNEISISMIPNDILKYVILTGDITILQRYCRDGFIFGGELYDFKGIH